MFAYKVKTFCCAIEKMRLTHKANSIFRTKILAGLGSKVMFIFNHKTTFISHLSYLLRCCTLPDKHGLSHGMYFYQVMMMLHFLNDVPNEAESTQK